jgi:hypothetical protein
LAGTERNGSGLRQIADDSGEEHGSPDRPMEEQPATTSGRTDDAIHLYSRTYVDVAVPTKKIIRAPRYNAPHGCELFLRM